MSKAAYSWTPVDVRPENVEIFTKLHVFLLNAGVTMVSLEGPVAYDTTSGLRLHPETIIWTGSRGSGRMTVVASAYGDAGPNRPVEDSPFFPLYGGDGPDFSALRADLSRALQDVLPADRHRVFGGFVHLIRWHLPLNKTSTKEL